MEKFSYEENGYNRKEVNNFIGEVIKETEGIIIRVKKQNAEIEMLKQKLRHYENLEETLENAVKQAEEANNHMRKIAQEESEMIINDAKNNASRIVNEALLRADKIEHNSNLIENNIRTLKRKLKSLAEEQMAMVEEIEILELNPE